VSEPKTILLVEDNANDVALTLAALEETEQAHEIVVVRDGQQALDYLLCQGAHEKRSGPRPTVVLLDLKLPKVDGLEVLSRIKQHPELKTLPVVMLTSSREDLDLKRSYSLGVNAYVVKPVAFTEFVSTLKTLGFFWAVLNQSPPQGKACPP
jgi:CheY-like chemotaxis protein